MSRAVKWGGIGLGAVAALLGATYVGADRIRPSLGEAERAELARKGRAERFVRTSRGVMHVRLSGPQNGPAVLLVHGGAVGGCAFENWRESLADAGYRVLVPDLLGYGYSDRPKVPYTAEFYTTQLSELLIGLAVTEPVNIVGGSLGGAIVTAFAARYPSRVTSVVLLAPSGGGRFRIVARPLDWPVMGDWVFRTVGPSRVRNMIKAAYRPGPARDKIMAWMADQTRYRGFGDGILNTIRNYDSTWQPEAAQAVGRAGMPVLAAWGTEDKVVAYSQAEQLRQWIPQLRLFTLDSHGHSITYGQAETLLAQVIPFLDDAVAKARA